MRDLGSPRSELGRGVTWSRAATWVATHDPGRGARPRLRPATQVRRDLGRDRATQEVAVHDATWVAAPAWV